MERQYVGIDLHRRRSVIVRRTAAGETIETVRIDNDPLALAAELAKAGPDPEVVLEHGDLAVVDLDQVPQRLHAYGVGPPQLARVEQGGAGHAEQVAHGDRHALFGQHGVDLGLEPRAQGDEFRPVPHELPQLPQRRGRHPRLRQAPEAQQVHQVGGVALVVLDPPVPPAVAQRVGQVHLRPVGLQQVGRPVPPVARLEREVGHLLADDAGWRTIQAIPGVGRTLAAIFVAELGDVARFPTADKVCCWAGLTPRHRESDTTVRRGPISKQGSRLVRWAAIEAAQRVGAGTWLSATFAALATRRDNRAVARVAVARRILTLVYYGLRDGEIRCLRADEA